MRSVTRHLPLLALAGLATCNLPKRPGPDSPPRYVFPSPEVTAAKVWRRGERAKVTLAWQRIGAAAGYQIELSRSWRFDHRILAQTTARPRFVSDTIEPGIYFWRVRATDTAGDGAFSATQIIDATVSGPKPTRRRPGQDWQPVAEDPVPLPPSGLALVLKSPRARAVVRTPSILVKGRATPEAKVRIGSAPVMPLEPDGAFSQLVSLVHGKNQVAVSATLDHETQTRQRLVFYADPRRLGGTRPQFEALRQELLDSRALMRGLHRLAGSLRARLPPAKYSESVGEVEAEITYLEEAKRDLEAEIDRAIAQIEELLSQGPPP